MGFDEEQREADRKFQKTMADLMYEQMAAGVLVATRRIGRDDASQAVAHMAHESGRTRGEVAAEILAEFEPAVTDS